MVLILLLFQQQDKLEPWQQQPTIVHLVDIPTEINKPKNEKPREFEIDQHPIKPQQEVPVESFRKADQDQKVEQEQAPQGDDVRDQTTQPVMPSLPPRPKQNLQKESVQQQLQQPDKKESQPVEEKVVKNKAKTTPLITSESTHPKRQPTPLSPEQLRPDSSILDQIVGGNQGERIRVKERKDIEIGDTVWLNLQHNLLVSFFRRFHDKIELVWNYPTKAAMNGIEGTLELLIIVNKKGELIDVDLIQTSGSDLLDFEAIQAVYRAAPFGPLTKHYPHENLKIRAHFSYHISGKFIYGR